MLVFTRADARRTRAALGGAERLRQRRDLDRIAQRRAGAVRLDVADRVRVDAGHRLAPSRSPAAWPSTLGAV